MRRRGFAVRRQGMDAQPPRACHSIAMPDSRIGRTGGLNQRKCGVASMRTERATSSIAAEERSLRRGGRMTRNTSVARRQAKGAGPLASHTIAVLVSRIGMPVGLQGRRLGVAPTQTGDVTNLIAVQGLQIGKTDGLQKRRRGVVQSTTGLAMFSIVMLALPTCRMDGPMPRSTIVAPSLAAGV